MPTAIMIPWSSLMIYQPAVLERMLAQGDPNTVATNKGGHTHLSDGRESKKVQGTRLHFGQSKLGF